MNPHRLSMVRPRERMIRQVRLFFIIATAAMLLSWNFPINAKARAVELDPSFGNDGMVTTDFSHGYDAISDIAVDPYGKIVVAGARLARYNPDGTLDTSFGYYGSVVPQFPGSAEFMGRVAIQRDGKVLVPLASSEERGFQLARYNYDGSPDLSFGTDGLVKDFVGEQAIAQQVAIQHNGKIVVAGFTRIVGTSMEFRYALVRYEPDGSRDDSFGTNGVVIANMHTYGGIMAMDLDTRGRIVVSGTRMARFNTDGSLDSSFGSDGIVHPSYPAYPIYDIAIRPDGKIFTAGETYIWPESDNFALTCYNSDGSLDLSFGSGGTVNTNFPGYSDFVGRNDTANTIALQPDGKIILAGSTSGGWLFTLFAMARYNSDGSLDTLVTTDFGFWDRNSRANAIAILPEGRIILVGSTASSISGATDFALACYKWKND